MRTGFYRQFRMKRRSLLQPGTTVQKSFTTIGRFALPVGFLVSLGLAFLPSGGCGGVQPIAEMPVRFSERQRQLRRRLRRQRHRRLFCRAGGRDKRVRMRNWIGWGPKPCMRAEGRQA
jgi:hypothetical protein